MTIFNYKKAVNEGMRTAIKQIITQVCKRGIGKGQIYLKFKINETHLQQIPRLIPDYAVFFTLDLSQDAFKNLQVAEDCFIIEIPCSLEEIPELATFVKIEVAFKSVVHLIDVEQNVSIEIEEDDEELERSSIKQYHVS